MRQRITLDFGGFLLDAVLFDTPVAEKFARHLPYQVRLTQWGNELYGSIGTLEQLDLGEENPVPDIPAGGIAYTREGNLVCIFFGQRPAWAVEYIGQIRGNDWHILTTGIASTFVEIRSKD